MARKQASPLPAYAKPIKGKDKAKMVSCRVDAHLYDEFQQAIQTAERADIEITLTSVVDQALRDAVEWVSNHVVQQANETTTADHDDESAEQPAPKPARKRRKKSDEQPAEETTEQ